MDLEKPEQINNQEDLSGSTAEAVELGFISGSLFARHYQLQEIIGVGAGSVVYRALHNFLGEIVAIKY
jgi:hypothetical protein